jgi:hypothetical protein
MAVTYLLEAKENYAARELAEVNDAGTLYAGVGASQTFTGDSFDPVSRTFVYSACEYLTAQPTAPYNLWNGSDLIAVGDPVNQHFAWNWHTLTKDIDTGAVASYQAYDSTKLVPAGIGGTDGTARRYLDAIAQTENQLRRLVSPRNQNLWQHLDGDTCSIFLLRKADDYVQVISPLVSTTHMEIAGLTADWLYVFEYSSGGGSHPAKPDPRSIVHHRRRSVGRLPAELREFHPAGRGQDRLLPLDPGFRQEPLAVHLHQDRNPRLQALQVHPADLRTLWRPDCWRGLDGRYPLGRVHRP